MDWREVRERYPRQWLLVEAIDARSEGEKRVLEDLAVVQSFPDAKAAMDGYKELHRRDPQRELYVLHTDRDRLDISEVRWLGLRTA
ncbi:MAG: hypothetical protein ACJ75H_14905 [Thermoanaerobaculia bacterium]